MNRDERTIKEIIEYLKKQNGNCSNELSNVEGLCLVNYIEHLEKEIERLTNLCNKYEEEHKTTFEKWQKDIQVLSELEKWLEEQIELFNGTESMDFLCNTYLVIEDKIKELKENK